MNLMYALLVDTEVHSSPFHWACAKGRYEIVEYLINLVLRDDGPQAHQLLTSRSTSTCPGDHPNGTYCRSCKFFKDRSGMTALHWASNEGLSEVCLALLAREDLDVNGKDVYEKTAFDMASSKGLSEVCQALLARGAMPGTDGSGMTVFAMTTQSQWPRR